ncbi:hypothetical protein [Acidocella sp.]|uniref:hypothetical protein n=1 Tax=Acidocella sp. TaxID=50710 RepID=UPI0026371402|nr:hypothetical protein [Acidocella sp.]
MPGFINIGGLGQPKAGGGAHIRASGRGIVHKLNEFIKIYGWMFFIIEYLKRD